MARHTIYLVRKGVVEGPYSHKVEEFLSHIILPDDQQCYRYQQASRQVKEGRTDGGKED